MKAWKKSVLGTAMAGALLVGGSALPAQAAVSGGTIIGGGTAVQGTYTVTCDYKGQEIITLIKLSQRQGRTVNSTDQQESSFFCPYAGEFERTYTVFGSAPYRPGTATLRLGVNYFNLEGQFEGEKVSVHEIRLSNR